MADLHTAIRIAVEAHSGQTRKNGMPYVTHPFRVMLRMKTDEERMAAILHDVIEDTAVTLEDLSARGFPACVLKALDLLTKRDGGDYDAYLDGIAADPIARRVKLADLRDNLNLEELPELGEKDLRRAAKYRRALAKLQVVEDADGL